MPNTLEELAEMLARRDNISLEEAWRMIDATTEDIDYILASETPSYEEVEDVLVDNLGLEPDYLFLFL